jgi:predicted DNA-binding protein
MTTKNPRINVTFEEETINFLSSLARHEHKSLSSIVKELALEALEKREDKYLSKLARKLEMPDTKTYSHSDAWK